MSPSGVAAVRAWVIVSHTLTHYLVMLFPRLPNSSVASPQYATPTQTLGEFTTSWFQISTGQIDLVIPTGLVTKIFIFRSESDSEFVAFTIVTRFRV